MPNDVKNHLPEGWSVKPLEWEPHPAGGEIAVGAGLAFYRIHRNGNVWLLGGNPMGSGGKAAAQAHFDKVIQSVIVAPPSSPSLADPQAEVERLRVTLSDMLQRERRRYGDTPRSESFFRKNNAKALAALAGTTLAKQEAHHAE